MKVLLNSDVMFATYLVGDSLPKALDSLCKACTERGVGIVIPETALLEYNRKQDELVAQKRRKLREAYRLLEDHGVDYARVDPETLVERADIVDLMHRRGATVEVVRPTLEDFQGAHGRACTRQAPCPPKTASDEMRDLVIWEIALRIARDEERVVLVSKDQVHTHSRGDLEAERHRLTRLKGIDDVLTLLGIETPAGRAAREVLDVVWERIARTLPLGPVTQLRELTEISFVRDRSGFLSQACFRMKAQTPDGEPLSCTLTIHFSDGTVVKICASELDVGGTPQDDITVEPDEALPFPGERTDYEDRVDALKRTIG